MAGKPPHSTQFISERNIHLHTETATNTASHAAAHIGGRRDIVIDTQPKGDTAATVAIVSISDQDWYISRTHGVYHIPACPKAAPSTERAGDRSGDRPADAPGDPTPASTRFMRYC